MTPSATSGASTCSPRGPGVLIDLPRQLVTAVISSQSVGVTIPADMLSAYKPGLAVVTGVAVLGLVIALTGLRGLSRRRAVEETEAAELAAVQKELAEEEMTPAA